jgi:hypothetical protein
MSTSKIIGLSILSLVVIIVLGMGLDLVGLGWKKFIGPKRQNVETEIFHETKSYVDAMKGELADLYREYTLAESSEEKAMIHSVVRAKFGAFDVAKLDSYELQKFLTDARGW